MAIVLTILGVLIPNAIVVWCIRRWLEPVPWRVAAILFVLTCVFLGPSLFTNDVPVPLDEVMRGYPYRGVAGDVHPRNPLTNDTVKQILPWMDAVRREFRHGRWPLWNPWAFSGYPLLGNGQSAPFAMPFFLTLFVPLPKQLVAMAGFKLFTAMLFTYLVARREGLSTVPSLIAAVLFSYSVFQNVYLYYPLTSVTSLLPAAVYAVRRSCFVLLTIVTAAALAGGHPESVVHLAIGALLFVGIRAMNMRIVAAIVLGICLAAPAWMPVAEQIADSARVAEIGRGRGMTPVMPGLAAWTLLTPDAFGNPARGNWNWILNYSVVAPTYVGLLPLACLPVALFGARRDRMLVLWIAVLFLLAMNWTPIAQAINANPPLSFIANDRLRFVLTFFVAILTARVIERLRLRVVFAVAGVAVGALLVYFYTQRGGTMVPALLLFAVIATAFARPKWVPFAALGAVAVELVVLNHVFNAPGPARFYKPETPLLKHLQALRGSEPFRILGHDWVFMPNASVHYELEDVRGSDPMAPRQYLEFFDRIAASDQASDVRRVVNPNQPAIDFLNVRYLLTEPTAKPGGHWIERYHGPDGKLFENPRAFQRFFAKNAEIHTVTDRPTRFTVSITTSAPTFIASSQPMMRGWSVRIGGKRVPIQLVNGAFIGFVAPAGKSTAIVEYQPVVFRVALLIALCALAALVILARMPRRST